MGKAIHCSDIGFECEGIIRADSDEEIIQLAAKHAQEVHGLERITPEIFQKVKAAIRED